MVFQRILIHQIRLHIKEDSAVLLCRLLIHRRTLSPGLPLPETRVTTHTHTRDRVLVSFVFMSLHSWCFLDYLVGLVKALHTL